MAFPAIRSFTQTSTDTDGTSIVATKPTGLAVGDLMLAWIGLFNNGADRGAPTPAGWTEVTTASAANRNTLTIFKRIADAADVAAANFTFTYTGTVDKSYAALFAITGYAPGSDITLVEFDVETAPTAATTVTYTTALTPLTTDSLLFSGWLISDLSLPTAPTLSGYTVTPSTTLTEQVEQTIRDGSSVAAVMGIATGNKSGTASITSRAVTVDQSVDGRRASVILLVNSVQSVTADVSPLAITPAIQGITVAQINATTEVSRIAMPPTLFGAEVKDDSDTTRWTNPDKISTTWTNPDK